MPIMAIAIDWMLPLALIGIMLAVGLGLSVADFERVRQNSKAFLTGLCAQLILLPLVAFLVIKIAGLSRELAVGLFIISLCPGGTTSNLFSLLTKADLGLSVSLTAASSFIAPITLAPLSLWAMGYFGVEGEQFNLPLLTTWSQLFSLTLLPVVTGMLLRYRSPQAARWLIGKLNLFGLLVLSMAIVLVIIEMEDKLWDYLSLAGPAVIVLNISCMLLGILLGRIMRLGRPQIRTLCLEIGLQNGTLALVITSTLLSSTAMSIAPSVYGLVMFITAGAYSGLVLFRSPTRSTVVQHSLD